MNEQTRKLLSAILESAKRRWITDDQELTVEEIVQEIADWQVFKPEVIKAERRRKELVDLLNNYAQGRPFIDSTNVESTIKKFNAFLDEIDKSTNA